MIMVINMQTYEGESIDMEYKVLKDEEKGFLLLGVTVEDVQKNTDWDLKRTLTDEAYTVECVKTFIKDASEWFGFSFVDYKLYGYFNGCMWVRAKINEPLPNIDEAFGDFGLATLKLNEFFKKMDK